MYIVVVLAMTFAQRLLINNGIQVVSADGRCITDWVDLVYFNLVTVMTIGYGDYAPLGLGRILIAIEALAGVGLFGAVIGVVVVKAMLPRHDSVVFSRYCYFDKKAQRFVVQFINTTKTRLVNADMCSVLKIGRANWIVRSAYRTPYIGESGWMFSVNGLWEYLDKETLDAALAEKRFPLKEIDAFLATVILYDDDGLKFGITGSHGFSVFSVAKKYSFSECWVVESKQVMSGRLLLEPDFKSIEFASALHYVPQTRQTFQEYAQERGATVVPGTGQQTNGSDADDHAAQP